MNVVPRPGRLTTSIRPPCASAIHLQMASPRPAPGRSPVRVRAESARQNRSKMWGRSPGAMPMPVSATLRVSLPLTGPSCRRTLPPAGVYFTALVRRLRISCRIRVASTDTTSGSAGVVGKASQGGEAPLQPGHHLVQGFGEAAELVLHQRLRQPAMQAAAVRDFADLGDDLVHRAERAS